MPIIKYICNITVQAESKLHGHNQSDVT